MKDSGLDIGFPITLALLAIGLIAWCRPLMIYRLEYKWTALWVRSLMSQSSKEDMRLLFNEPEQWRIKHRTGVQWTRYAVGCGALVMGIVMLLIIVVEFVTR